MMRSLLKHCHLLKELTRHVSLEFPKKLTLRGLADYRSISLCNVSSKIISQRLANRLRKYLSKIIFPLQSALVLNNDMHNNILIAHEILILFLKNATQRFISRKVYMAIKLEIEKAYDSWEEFHKKCLTDQAFCN